MDISDATISVLEKGAKWKRLVDKGLLPLSNQEESNAYNVAIDKGWIMHDVFGNFIMLTAEGHTELARLLEKRENRQREIENLELNRRRDWREQRLFLVAIASLFISVCSAVVAALAFYVAGLPK